MSLSPTPDAAAFGARERRALLGILLGVALGSLEAAIANTALPTIAASLKAAPADSIWIINAYQLAVVASLLPFAALGDRVGVRRVFLGGLAFFTRWRRLLCVLAPSLPVLVAGRALQGIGAGALMSVNIALIRLIYPAAAGPRRGAERAGGGAGLRQRAHHRVAGAGGGALALAVRLQRAVRAAGAGQCLDHAARQPAARARLSMPWPPG
jgi:MFS family permease